MLSRMCNFYPRPPRGGRLIYQATTEDDRKFLSTPSARRATFFRCTSCWIDTISIHALREEGDFYFDVICKGFFAFLSTPSARRATRGTEAIGQRFCNFYPRPPRGGRQCNHSKGNTAKQFLSTPSARRATFFAVLKWHRKLDFYPRPPRGGRRIRTLILTLTI